MPTHTKSKLAYLVIASACMGLMGPLKAADPASAPPTSLNFAALKQATGAPPAPNSPKDHDDYVIVLWLQAHRSAEQIANSWQVLSRELLSFDSALGTSLTESSPILSKGLLDFVEPVNQARAAIKGIYKRPRPFATMRISNPAYQRNLAIPSLQATPPFIAPHPPSSRTYSPSVVIASWK